MFVLGVIGDSFSGNLPTTEQLVNNYLGRSDTSLKFRISEKPRSDVWLFASLFQQMRSFWWNLRFFLGLNRLYGKGCSCLRIYSQSFFNHSLSSNFYWFNNFESEFHFSFNFNHGFCRYLQSEQIFWTLWSQTRLNDPHGLWSKTLWFTRFTRRFLSTQSEP